MLNVVGKVPVMDLVDRLATFFRTSEPQAPSLPALPEAAPEGMEKVPMMEYVHQAIASLKSSERDYCPVKKKSGPCELSAKEQRDCRKIQFDLNAAYFLKELTRKPVKLLELGYEDEHNVFVGISSMAEPETAQWILREYQDQYLREQKYLFVSEHYADGDEIALVQGCTDPFVLMELALTNPSNSQLKARQIVEKFKDLHARFGLRITGMGLDFCEAELLTRDLSYRALAEELLDFCPEGVYCSETTVEALEALLEREGWIYLRWD